MTYVVFLQISRYTWNLRGQLKGEANRLVEAAYNFQTGSNRIVAERNRQLAANLRTKSAFTYRVRRVALSCISAYT